MAIVQLTEHICYSMRLILKMVRLSSSIWNCGSLVGTMSISENDRSERGLIYFEAEPHTSSLLFMQRKVYIDTRDVYESGDTEQPQRINQRAVLSSLASWYQPITFFRPFTNIGTRGSLKNFWLKMEKGGKEKWT